MISCTRLLGLAALSLSTTLVLAQNAPPAPTDSAASQGPPASDPASSDQAALRRQVQEQEQRLRELERRLSADAVAQTGPVGANGAPAVTPASGPNALLGSIGEDGIRLQSADGLNVLHLGTNLSVDYRYFDDAFDSPTADTWLVRKARLILEGQFAGVVDFRFMPDFGLGRTIIQDAWMDVRVAPWLVFTAGKYKAPVGLERLQLEQFARFIEAGLTADLQPYRDLGGELGGSVGGGLLTYQIGAFDGAPDGGSTDANSVPDSNSSGKLTWNARLFGKPFAHTALAALQGLGLGVAGTYVNASGTGTATGTNSLLAADKTPGQQPLFAYRGNTALASNNATVAHGIERRLVPQFYWYYRSVYLLGEDVQQTQQVARLTGGRLPPAATLHNSAWQIQGGFFLTGEQEAYDSAAPRREVGKGGFGAWELVARCHQVRYDGAAFAGGSGSFANPATSVREASAKGVGLNWYLTRIFKVQLDFEATRFRGGAPTGSRSPERVFTSQFAFIF